MGARAQVIITNGKNEGVALYTHWGSGSLPQTVARALARRQRWDDDAYLARIVFCEMMKDIGETLDGELSLGIEPGRNVHFDLDYPPIVVNVGERTVTHAGLEGTFEEFIALQLSGAARQR